MKKENSLFKTLKNLIKKYWDILSLLFSLTLFYGVLRLFEITCIIKFLTGVSCPGCGMTRAYLSLLRLDFAAAFDFHPLWPLVIVLVVMLFIFRNNLKLFNGSLIGFVTIMIIVFFIRLFYMDSQVVVCNIDEGIIYRIISKVLSLF